MTWQSRIYGKSGPLEEDILVYKEIKRTMAQGCGNVCRRCRKRFKSYMLSLHHIVPRSKGGSGDFDNLILLCNECHDYVEENISKYGSRPKIENSLRKKRKKDEAIKKSVGKNWQSWVYGGSSNPNLH